MSDGPGTPRTRPGPIARQRARNARLLAQAEALAAFHAAQVAPAAAGTAAAGPRRVAVLPANTRNTCPLPDAARAAFLDRLAEVTRRVFRDPVRDNAAPMSEAEQAARRDARNATEAPNVPDAPSAGSGAAWPVPDPALAAIQGAGCGTCRGECCTAGGTHAFLREDSITRVRAQLVEAGGPTTAEALVSVYRAHLPARHYRGSCVYHTTRGCALPRTLRSNLCNRYVCGSLTQLTRSLAAEDRPEAYVAAADSAHLRRLALVTADGAEPLSLRRA